MCVYMNMFRLRLSACDRCYLVLLCDFVWFRCWYHSRHRAELLPVARARTRSVYIWPLVPSRARDETRWAPRTLWKIFISSETELLCSLMCNVSAICSGHVGRPAVMFGNILLIRCDARPDGGGDRGTRTFGRQRSDRARNGNATRTAHTQYF